MNHAIRPLAAAIGLALAMAASTAAQAVLVTRDDGTPRNVAEQAVQAADGLQRYIVRLHDAPAALYDGHSARFAAIPRRAQGEGGLRPDFRSPQAQAYLAYLEQQQSAVLDEIAQRLQRRPAAVWQLRHALNAVVLDLTAEEAQHVRALGGVAAVMRDEPREIATEYSTQLIGATRVGAVEDRLFADAFEPAAVRNAGAGTVLAVLDTGINPDNASFAGTDERGYRHVNPLGEGVYLGLCAAGQPHAGRCNSKLIGIYDSTGGATANGIDGNGHGSHTASTAAGNRRSANYVGLAAVVAGVAPQANVVSYRVCTPTGQCASSAAVAAVDQVIQDGIADSLNYSISGGFLPWSDPVSQSFLAANNAGVFVAAAAGNTGATVTKAVEGTSNHLEPWVATVAATTNDHKATSLVLRASGGASPLAEFAVKPGNAGSIAGAVPSLPVAVSATYDANNDGCAAYAAGAFSGKAALIKRATQSGCTAQNQINNAIGAGAGVVLIAGSADAQNANVSVAVAVPVFDLKGSDGTALKTYATDNPGAAAQVQALPRDAATVDEMGWFSLRGPAPYAYGKPDLAMPGVDILAAYQNSSGLNANAVIFMSGTSMATPHAAGAALLLREQHSAWTPAELKSALMMSASESVTAEGVAADANARGSGRVFVPAAARVGLVLNETGANFAAANPLPSGSTPAGDASTLNLAQVVVPNCITLDRPAQTSHLRCTVQRTFRSTQGRRVVWTPSVVGSIAGGVQFSPALLTVEAGAQQTLSLSFDSAGWTPATQSATLVLTPDDASLAPLHLPMAVGLNLPDISASPRTLNVNAPAGQVTRTSLRLANSGGAELRVERAPLVDGSTQAANVILQRPILGTGLTATHTPPWDFFSMPVALQSFTVDVPGPLAKIEAYMQRAKGIYSLTGTNQYVSYWIVPDVAGQPANPIQNASNAIWTARLTETLGVWIAGNEVFQTETLDFVANDLAQSPPTLQPGKYWLGVARQGRGLYALFGLDDYTLWRPTLAGNGTRPYTVTNTQVTANAEFSGLALRIDQQVTCGPLPAWLSVDAAGASPISVPGGLVGNDARSLDVLVDPAQFPAGETTAAASVCLRSNDAANPVFRVVVKATRS
jgi:hypothetical protein